MAYMSKEERRDLTKDVHKTYGWRKFLIFIDVVLLIAFIVLIFVGTYLSDKGHSQWDIWKEGGEQWTVNGLSTFGIIMLIVAIILVLMSVTIIVLTFSMRSPRKVTEQVLKLEAAPLTGRRTSKSASKADINRERVEGRPISKIKKIRK